MGYTLFYVSVIVIIPLLGLFFKSATNWSSVRAALHDPELLSSLRLTFGLSFAAACINLLFGFITAWTLVRYPFPGRRLVDAIIDLPFALPTAVSGITLATLFAPTGWFGHLGGNLAALLHMSEGGLAWLNLDISWTKAGMLLALIFIGLPFMVRTLQPALQDLDPENEEAAGSLGATRVQTFWRVVLPSLLPAVLTGFSLSFARAIGEYGSVVFISSNRFGETITAHLIRRKLEGDDYVGATTLGVVMLVISFAVLLTVNGVQWWATRRSRLGGG
jgi:sulfate/thiosulfate transport system permease protein